MNMYNTKYCMLTEHEVQLISVWYYMLTKHEVHVSCGDIGVSSDICRNVQVLYQIFGLYLHIFIVFKTLPESQCLISSSCGYCLSIRAKSNMEDSPFMTMQVTKLLQMTIVGLPFPNTKCI